MSKRSPTDPIIAKGRKRFRRFDSRLSLLLDRAQLQLEAATDPGVVAAYRELVDELERIALGRAKA